MDVNQYEGWVETGELANAGDVGGDSQVGEAYDRRFVHPDKPGCLITVYAYGVAYENDAVEGGLEYGVEEMIERLICTDMADPGGTEIGSKAEYTAIDDYATLHNTEEAQQAAHKHLAELDAGDLSWNGEL